MQDKDWWLFMILKLVISDKHELLAGRPFSRSCMVWSHFLLYLLLFYKVLDGRKVHSALIENLCFCQVYHFIISVGLCCLYKIQINSDRKSVV